ncbi:hypothetical protein DK261_20220 [Pseudomonas sp. RW409]|nr:hypothetical protein DK261_20220 [Pseudomonas sp. RW409]
MLFALEIATPASSECRPSRSQPAAAATPTSVISIKIAASLRPITTRDTIDPGSTLTRSRCRACEAAIGTAGAAKPDSTICLANRLNGLGRPFSLPGKPLASNKHTPPTRRIIGLPPNQTPRHRRRWTRRNSRPYSNCAA